MWAAGEQILLRYRRQGTLSTIVPVLVVEDAADYIALYLPAETPIKRPVCLDGSPIPRSMPFEQRYALPRKIGDSVWHTNARLFLARPGAAHTFSLFWRGADWSFLGWYVDLQAPFARTGLGFESEDHVLDLVIKPDLSWSWKDEDEFADARRVGRFTPAEARAIRAEGEQVIQLIEACGWPFDAGWESWRPHPAWKTPTIPADWDAN